MAELVKIENFAVANVDADFINYIILLISSTTIVL